MLREISNVGKLMEIFTWFDWIEGLGFFAASMAEIMKLIFYGRVG